MNKKNEMVKAETGGAVAKVKTNGEIKSLAATLETEAQKHKLLEDYIIKQLKQDVDFGIIKMEKNGKKFVSKPCLFKPGAEKVVNRTKTIAKFRRDDETWEMMGKQPGLICYICELYNGDKIIGEGRGAASMQEYKFKNNPNTAIKIAEKRAKIDAVLATFALSARFTQDLEDMQKIDNYTENATKTVKFPQNGTNPRASAKTPVKAKEAPKKIVFRAGGKEVTRDKYIKIITEYAEIKGVRLGDLTDVDFPDMRDDEVLAMWPKIKKAGEDIKQ